MTQPDPTPFPIDHVIEQGDDADPALALRDGTLNYADLRTRVGRLAAWLKSQIPETGARIASWSAKGELTCLLPLAAPRAGLVHVPINPMLKRAQVAHILADSGAAMLIGTPARLSTLEQDDLPAGCAQVEESAALEAAKACDPLPKSAADPQTIAAILYTSGSTGKPKGVVLSHANLWLGAVSVAHYLKLRSDDVTLAVLPLAFDYGQNQLLSTWRAGGCVAPLDYLMPRDVTKAVAKHQATTLAAVPPLWRQLVEARWEDGAGDSLKRLTNSGGALTPDLIDAMRATWPQADIYPMYGLTEAFRSTFLDPGLVATHPTSMGKAVPFAEVLVVNETSPVIAFVAVLNTMSASSAEVTKVPVPPTVSAPLWVMLPRVAVADRSPSTVEAPKAKAVALTIVASESAPELSFVVRVMPPVTARVPRLMLAASAPVTNVAPPADTVKVPASMMLPRVAVMLVAPPTVPAARLTAVALTIVAVPTPLVLSVSRLPELSVCAS